MTYSTKMLNVNDAVSTSASKKYLSRNLHAGEGKGGESAAWTTRSLQPITYSTQHHHLPSLSTSQVHIPHVDVQLANAAISRKTKGNTFLVDVPTRIERVVFGRR